MTVNISRVSSHEDLLLVKGEEDPEVLLIKKIIKKDQIKVVAKVTIVIKIEKIRIRNIAVLVGTGRRKIVEVAIEKEMTHRNHD